MTTEKYNLHTIDYSVQGWDAIMATDMEKIDDMIPTRIIGTLGETVVAYDALCLDATPPYKWYKAKADGVLQPCLGLAVEGGDALDEIRIHQMGEIINFGWAWATIGAPIYLDPDTAGELTQTPQTTYRQLVGYALSMTKMLALIQPSIYIALSIYANNAAAIDGGLGVGDFYRSGTDPDIVYVVHYQDNS